MMSERMWRDDQIQLVTFNYRYNRTQKGHENYQVSNVRYYFRNGIIEKTTDINDFIENYKEIKNKEVNIKKEDIIYFCKESKYPRFKFTSNCSNKKTIQPDKADYIIVPDVEFFSNNSKSKQFILCNLTNNIYHVNLQINHLKMGYPNENDLLQGGVQILKDKFLIQDGHYEIIDCLEVSYNSTPLTIDTYRISRQYIDKCISEDELEKYVGKDSTILTEEYYNSINTMLSSKDHGSVELGIKMLNNFNVDKSALKLALLIRGNAGNMFGNKAVNTVGFKNLLKQLNLDTLQNLRYSNNLNFLNNVYSSTTEDNNKMDIEKAYKEEVERRIKNFTEQTINNFVIPINIKLTVE